MLNTDWMAKKQLGINSINHFYNSRQKMLKKSEFQCHYKLTNLTLSHVFHTDINAYCQQNCYVQFAIYTDLLTLRAS